MRPCQSIYNRSKDKLSQLLYHNSAAGYKVVLVSSKVSINYLRISCTWKYFRFSLFCRHDKYIMNTDLIK